MKYNVFCRIKNENRRTMTAPVVNGENSRISYVANAETRRTVTAPVVNGENSRISSCLQIQIVF